jgi:uncharacterized coiled-coil DUF342 family protein
MHNEDAFEPEQITQLFEAADLIRELDGAVDSLIAERDAAYEQIDRHKQGFEGCCTACEPVALKNQELLKERDEALKKIDELEDVCGDSADRMVELVKERDSARWEVCELSGNGSIDSAMRVAEERGWNLTKDDDGIGNCGEY